MEITKVAPFLVKFLKAVAPMMSEIVRCFITIIFVNMSLSFI